MTEPIDVALRSLRFLHSEIEAGERTNWNAMEASVQNGPESLDEETLTDLIEKADRGDKQADARLLVAAARELEQGSALQAYAAKALMDCIKSPKNHRLMNRPRDIQIVIAVHAVCRECNLKPTRNAAKHGKQEAPSGCSIVSLALARMGMTLSEDAVELIWKNLSYLR